MNCDPDQILQFAELMFLPGQAFEIRLLGAKKGNGFSRTASGFFARETAHKIGESIDSFCGYEGAYISLNPVNPALQARCSNRIDWAQRGLSTSECDILRRQWLVIDCDAARPAGISSTDDEKKKAQELGQKVTDIFRAKFEAEPVVVDSGNGYQLFYRIDEAVDSDIVGRVLAWLVDHAVVDGAVVDVALSDAARIVRLPGTWNCKGDETDDRRHRLARIAHAPDERVTLTTEQLESITAPAETRIKSTFEGERGSIGNDVADDYNARGDVRALLNNHGWTFAGRSGENEAWCRPGKKTGQSASLNDKFLNVFSSSAAPLEQRAYTYYGLYAALEHDGNFSAASAELRKRGFGDTKKVDPSVVDLDAIVAAAMEKSGLGVTTKKSAGLKPFDYGLLRVPGLIGDTIEYMCDTAIRRQPILALAASLPLMGVLCGQKVVSQNGTTPNIYTLGVCDTAGGKEAARKVVREILHASGGDALRGKEKIKSDAGLIETLSKNAAVLSQVDEIGLWMKALSDPRAPAHLAGIISEILMLYSSADNPAYCGGAYADAERGKPIPYPCFCMHGTTTPDPLYESMSEATITTGLMSRLLIFETENHNERKQRRPLIAPPPQKIIDAARWWIDHTPTDGNVAGVMRTPRVVPVTKDADDIAWAYSESCDDKMFAGDVAQRSLWSRAAEHASKLALLYSASVNQAQEIDANAVNWGIAVVDHVVNNMLYMVKHNIADNKIEADIKKILKDIVELGPISQSDLTNRHQRMGPKGREDAIKTLEQGEQIEAFFTDGARRPAKYYRFIG